MSGRASRTARRSAPKKTQRAVPTPVVSPALATAKTVTSQGGAPLSSELRNYYEPRFGQNLSDIRVHTDATAGAAAEGIGATAFNRGNHIAFAPGAFRPDNPSGRRVLAHEIAHSVQPGARSTVRRTCPTGKAPIPPDVDKKFEAAVDAITSRSEFTALKKTADKLKKKRNRTGDDWSRIEAPEAAQDIIDGARASECKMFYIDILKKLFDLPEPVAAKKNMTASATKSGGTSRQQMAVEARGKMTTASKAEQDRLAPLPVVTNPDGTKTKGGPSEGGKHKDDEEAASKTRNFKWVENPDHGKFYEVDASDSTDIHVRVKILLKARGAGKAKDVRQIRGLQDAIEKAMAQPGYTVDIDFVRRGARRSDVFVIGVDPGEWPESQNWIKGPGTLAHEAQHVLNNADRYSYLNHAKNPAYPFAIRLNLFRRQMVRPIDTLASETMMEKSGSKRPLNEQDICSTAYTNRRGNEAGMEAKFKECLLARFAMRPAKDIQQIAKILTHPYEARNAGLLDILSDAYLKRPEKERVAGCKDIYDVECGMPPKEDFGEVYDISVDAQNHPIPRPHKPPPVSDLTKTKRSP